MVEPPATVAVVVVSGDDTDPSALGATLAALDAVGPGHISSVTVFGAGSSVASPPALDAAASLRVDYAPTGATTIDLDSMPPTPYVAVLRAGDVVTALPFTQIAREVLHGVAQDLYALCPDTDYLLNELVGTKPLVSVERDVTSLWVGSSGCLVSSEILRRCRMYALTGAAGVTSLYLEAQLHTGVSRPLAGTVTPGTALEDALTIEPYLYDPDWYLGFNDYFLRIFALAREMYGAVPRYLQLAYVYLLQWRLLYNRNTADKMALRGAVDQFWAGVSAALEDVDDAVLAAPMKAIRLDFRTRMFLLQRKRSPHEVKYRYFSGDVAVTLGPNTLATAASTRPDVDLMDLSGTQLRICGRYSFPFEATSRLVARYRGTDYPVTTTQRHSSTLVFGQELFRATSFEVTIPLPRGRAGSIRLVLVDDANRSDTVLNPRFRRTPSKLTTNKAAYWCAGGFVFAYRARRIAVARAGKRSVIKAELRFLQSLLRRRDPLGRQAAWLRVLYFASRPWFRRRTIWVYFDKIYKGGDNGEYAYRYAHGVRDGIKKYYLLRADAPDAARFKRDGLPFVAFGSIRSKLLYLNASTVLTTHINPQNFGGFAGGFEQFFRGLLTSDIVCIQHGLSVQDLAGTLNRVYDNTKLFCLASPVEEANLLRPEYDYEPRHLAMTGLARYDGLVSEDKRRILLMPTWRNYLAAPYRMGQPRGYSERFKHTDYFRIYNDLITDPRLLETARETGYEIMLLLHPVTSAQVDDFATSDRVKIVPSTGEIDFETMLREASLMITDYSGVQFDFAYMYKPVVYYHPEALPPSYAEGAYEYDTMALGPIAHAQRDLVDVVCDYMRNDCRLAPPYRDRIDAFFAFHDQASAARIYEAAKRLPEIEGGLAAESGGELREHSTAELS